jgi:hypothetical protein
MLSGRRFRSADFRATPLREKPVFALWLVLLFSLIIALRVAGGGPPAFGRSRAAF